MKYNPKTTNRRPIIRHLNPNRMTLTHSNGTRRIDNLHTKIRLLHSQTLLWRTSTHKSTISALRTSRTTDLIHLTTRNSPTTTRRRITRQTLTTVTITTQLICLTTRPTSLTTLRTGTYKRVIRTTKRLIRLPTRSINLTGTLGRAKRRPNRNSRNIGS